MDPKRKLDEVIAELPSREDLNARIELLIPYSCPRPPQLQLPSRLNIDSPYALFSLFFSEDIFEYISQSTNEYAQLKQEREADESESPETETTPSGSRAWKDTTAADIKVFIGILIYMGVHVSPRMDHYWRQDLHQGLIHTPHLYMSLKRFEQIKRFLHISRPTSADNHQPGDKRWWYKLEPVASSFERAARQYYQPGSNVSVDETMIRCFGRTKHTVKMPNKPIKQGYKIFALANRGYIWTFTRSSRLWGIVDLFRWPDISLTSSMVLEMIRKLPDLPSGPCLR